MNNTKKIIYELGKANYAAIVCHSNPDGDTLGGAFALSAALSKKGIQSDVLCNNILPDKYSFLNDVKLLNILDKNKYDVIVFVDCAEPALVGDLINDINLNDYITINIDHHSTNVGYANLNYVDSTSSSASELVLDVIKELEIDIDVKIAEYIYVGIVTDTGQFAHSYTSARTHMNAAFLLDRGIDFSRIHKKTFKTISLQKALLQKNMLDNIMLYHDNSVAISRLEKEDFISTGAKEEDTDSLINILLSIKGVRIAVLIRHSNEKSCKISFRSDNDIDISKVAKIIGGGGHKQAAGATFYGSAIDAQNKVLEEINSIGLLK
jgi:phosphoesterase RecJ-like protein